MPKMTDEHRAFARDLATMNATAHRLGLSVTGHALHRAVQAVGYEIAGELEAAGRASRGEYDRESRMQPGRTLYRE